MLRQGIQTNFKHVDLKTWGCYWFTLAAWSQFVSLKEWTDDDLIEKFEEHRKKNWINRTERDPFDGKIYPWARHPVAIFNDMAGVPDYFIGVDHSKDDKDFPKTKRFPVFYKRPKRDGFDHFALGELDQNGNVRIVFDSWQNSAAARGTPIHNFRKFR